MGLRACFAGSASLDHKSTTARRFQHWFLILAIAQTGLILGAALWSSSPLLEKLLRFYEPAVRPIDAVLPAEIPREGNTWLSYTLLFLIVHVYSFVGAIGTFILQSIFGRSR
jgi:hypothetical protein